MANGLLLPITLLGKITTNMSHKDRRQREITALREGILKAARNLAIKNGWPDVSIRDISKIIEYTPPVIYEHFKNKEAILIELADMGFQELRSTLNEAREKSSDPGTQMEDMSAAYWDWALFNAELYQVMFNLEGIRCSPTNSQALKESAKSVTESLRQLNMFSADMDELFFAWWAIMHGHVSLVMCGQISGMDNQMRRYMLSTVSRFVKSIN